MKIHGVNNLTKPFPIEVSSLLHGFRFDSIELDKKDVDKLLAMSPTQLHEYVESLSLRFRRSHAQVHSER